MTYRNGREAVPKQRFGVIGFFSSRWDLIIFFSMMTAIAITLKNLLAFTPCLFTWMGTFKRGLSPIFLHIRQTFARSLEEVDENAKDTLYCLRVDGLACTIRSVASGSCW